MQLGTPSQNVRVLPATSGNTLWVVLPEGCIRTDPSDCTSLRGFTFRINQSSTWTDQGLYQLPLYTQSLLGYSGNAQVGYDTVTLGWQGNGLPTLARQVIAGIATKDFYLGSLGLNPHPVNFTTFNDPQPSILRSLRNDRKIPSLSWSYTAGAYYQQPKMFGSLTLGGYDTTRFVPNNVSFPFGADISSDLLVGIRSITSDASGSPLLSRGIYAFIDSLVPHIWLPLEVCRAFEQAFGLVWDNSSELYVVTEAMHNRLVELNPNVTLKLGPSLTDGDTVDIVMPYGSFDLTASAPLIRRNSTRYFPLKRAQNETQYTLGRTFLQQAYIIADYDRSNFSVHQALFPLTSVPQNLIAIRPPGESIPNSKSKGGPSTGAIVGIVLAILLVIILCCVLAFFIRRRRRVVAEAAASANEAKDAEESRYRKAELDAAGITMHQIDSQEVKHLGAELTADEHGKNLWPQEMPTPEGKSPGAHLWPQEMPTPEGISPGNTMLVSELPAGDIPVSELDGQGVSRPRRSIEKPGA